MYIIASHIITPLGDGTATNYQAIVSGKTALQLHQSEGVAEPFYASLFEQTTSAIGRNRFESLCIQCAAKALQNTPINPANNRTVFILSTTKGNIEALANTHDINEISPAHSAERIAKHFNNHNTPIVVSNACTSGVCAQIVAMRLLRNGIYDHAVVIGADMQSDFIISGFQCLKALSDQRCQPYDANRKGLNLGEAVACIVMSNQPTADNNTHILAGSIANDANHISGPSRTAEGSLQVLSDILQSIDKNQIAVVNAHGTSTIYNDEMESIAMQRSGLTDITINSLKSIYGHTMGAAGLLETILTDYALRQGIVFPTYKFNTLGVSNPIKVSNQISYTDKRHFIKLLSGFGGVNAAIACSIDAKLEQNKTETPKYKTIVQISLNSDNDNPDEIYKTQIGNYPKFLKMDKMCKLGFIAAELICREHQLESDCAVIIFSRSGSLLNDIHYQQSMSDYPSPALFVYTLPNIVTGEIAIRHQLHAETSAYLLPYKDNNTIENIVYSSNHKQILYGWLEATENMFEAEMKLIKKL